MASGIKLLVERGEQLKQMGDLASQATLAGQLLVVEGEAGHGKTSLIDAFRSRLDHRYTRLEGACDPVSVPTPFAPFYEMLTSLPPTLRDDILDGDGRQRIYAGLLELLEEDPTILILEDLQWADEASLALVRYVGRRLVRTRSMVVLSYRPEEVDTTHPLLLVLADLASLATTVRVPPLTLEGVREMASGLDADPAQIHAATLGNPFFVEEILANPEERLPRTIEAAVMARVANLPTGALDLLEMVALSPEGLDLAVAQKHSPEAARNIDTSVQRRLLGEHHGRLRCRHDLIRLTVDRSVPPVRRRRIHLRLLEALEAQESGRGAVARLAHHSVEAGANDKAIRYSLEAAGIAEADGANRQARLHYEAALAFRDSMDETILDSTLLAAANVHCATNFLLEAAEAAQARIVFAGDEFDRGVRLASAAFFAARWGDVSLVREHVDRAFEILSGYEPSEALAGVLGVQASLAFWEARWRDAALLATGSLDMATKLGSRAMEASALLVLGKSLFCLGEPNWDSHLQRSVDLAMELGDLETACSGLNSLASLPLRAMELDLAVERFELGAKFAASHEMDAWYVAMSASKASCYLAQGRWVEAGDALERAVGWPTCASTECESHVFLATLKARYGAPDAAEAVENALTLTDRLGTYWEHVLAGVLALESAWLGILDRKAAIARYERLVDNDHVDSDPHAQKRLKFWLSLLEREPHSEDASDHWTEQGFVFEGLLFRAVTPSTNLDEIFGWLDDRQATGVMRALSQHLRRSGVTGIPRGVRSTTRTNPAGLTLRQSEVLALLAMGHTNGKIAEELFISEKTVGHHVSAILVKLAVENRVQAAAVASERGLI